PDYLRPHITGKRERNQAIDTAKLMTESFRFSSAAEPGLEMIDILVNATRRALMGNLGVRGWKEIPALMIHSPQQYIGLVSLSKAPERATDLPYRSVLGHFKGGGKNMLAPRFLRRP